MEKHQFPSSISTCPSVADLIFPAAITHAYFLLPRMKIIFLNVLIKVLTYNPNISLAVFHFYSILFWSSALILMDTLGFITSKQHWNSVKGFGKKVLSPEFIAVLQYSKDTATKGHKLTHFHTWRSRLLSHLPEKRFQVQSIQQIWHKEGHITSWLSPDINICKAVTISSTVPLIIWEFFHWQILESSDKISL